MSEESVVAFEQVVTKYGINCRNALLWLVVPPLVIFGITLIKSKNIRFLFNRKTSKRISPRVVGEAVSAFLHIIMPSIAWVIAAFLNSKIWVCYRAGFNECGIVKSCTKEEEYQFHITERNAKSEAQNIGLLMLSGATFSLAIITWGNHFFCAQPLKEQELSDLVREAARSELERYVMSRAKDRLQHIGKTLKELETANTKESQPAEKTDAERDNTTSTCPANQSVEGFHGAWLKTVDYKIDLYLEEFLSLKDVKMVYPEV